jgi:hypothetical protein
VYIEVLAQQGGPFVDLTEHLNDFLSWVWARHHNELSWYVRPLFLLPFCFFA